MNEKMDIIANQTMAYSLIIIFIVIIFSFGVFSSKYIFPIKEKSCNCSDGLGYIYKEEHMPGKKIGNQLEDKKIYWVVANYYGETISIEDFCKNNLK